LQRWYARAEYFGVRDAFTIQEILAKDVPPTFYAA